MIKISLTAPLIAFFLSGNNIYASESSPRQLASEELFDKVFGEKKTEKTIQVDVTYGQLFIGSINTTLSGDKVVSINLDDLKNILLPLVREEKVKLYQFKTGETSLHELQESFPVVLTYSPSELRFILTFPAENAKPLESKVFDEMLPYYSRQATQPAYFSAGLNYKLESVTFQNINQRDDFFAQSEFFSNIGKVSLESRQTYSSNRSQHWIRQNSKLIYDRPKALQRFELGDVNHQIIGYQQYANLGGFALFSDFSLNPYRTYSPTSAFEYLIENRSLVKTYVNGSLIKTEYMNAGRYQVRDIPLNNGINRIVVEITDELGSTKVLLFNEASSLDLLNEGTVRYSIASGSPSTDTDVGKKYSEQIFSTGFVQYGFRRNWTMGLYGEGNNKYQMLELTKFFLQKLGIFSGMD